MWNVNLNCLAISKSLVQNSLKAIYVSIIMIVSSCGENLENEIFYRNLVLQAALLEELGPALSDRASHEDVDGFFVWLRSIKEITRFSREKKCENDFCLSVFFLSRVDGHERNMIVGFISERDRWVIDTIELKINLRDEKRWRDESSSQPNGQSETTQD